MRDRSGVTRAGVVVAVGLSLLMSCSDPDSAGRRPQPEPAATATPPAEPGHADDTYAGAWRDAPRDALGPTAEWTNNVEVADLDADGDLDLLFANSGDERYWVPVENRVLLNRGDGTFADATRRVFGNVLGTTRVMKVADVDGDTHPDIVVGNIVSSRSRLYLGDGAGHFRDATATHLPADRLSVGDLELGDVDADRDLDIVLVDWGDGSPVTNEGGKVTMWLNDGAGRFTDVTVRRMPETLVRFSWDLELVDVDNDWDLDIATSCKFCSTSLIYENDATGTFVDVTGRRMPHFTNNYEFEPIDLDGDGFLDLVTVNDGDDSGNGATEHVFRNDGDGGYVDATAQWWPVEANSGWDDAVVVGLDVESDGDADFLLGSLDGPDRLLLNDGTGVLTLADDVFAGERTLGTLGLAVADLDGDGRLDVIEAGGEAAGHLEEHLHLAGELVPRDTAPPVVRAQLVGRSVVARVHDNRTPNRDYDWRRVWVRSAGRATAMSWYGENLFRGPAWIESGDAEVCATDASGNTTCAPVEATTS